MLYILLIATLTGSVHSQYRSLLVNEHNTYRRLEGAANMKKLVWSTQLEQEAKEWASRCTNSHKMSGWGENLAMHSVGGDMSGLMRRGVKMWYDEKQHYSPGMGFSQGTGHYTQMVWADSDQIGCGVHVCEANANFPMRYMYLVCFYNPPGNFNNREPYVPGPACSRCDPGYTCDNGLCTDQAGSTGVVEPTSPNIADPRIPINPIGNQNVHADRSGNRILWNWNSGSSNGQGFNSNPFNGFFSRTWGNTRPTTDSNTNRPNSNNGNTIRSNPNTGMTWNWFQTGNPGTMFNRIPQLQDINPGSMSNMIPQSQTANTRSMINMFPQSQFDRTPDGNRFFQTWNTPNGGTASRWGFSTSWRT